MLYEVCLRAIAVASAERLLFVVMSDIEKASSSQDGIQAQAVSLQLTESDIPGALLNNPIERHTMPQLRWWLMCRSIKNILGSEASLGLQLYLVPEATTYACWNH